MTVCPSEKYLSGIKFIHIRQSRTSGQIARFVSRNAGDLLDHYNPTWRRGAPASSHCTAGTLASHDARRYACRIHDRQPCFPTRPARHQTRLKERYWPRVRCKISVAAWHTAGMVAWKSDPDRELLWTLEAGAVAALSWYGPSMRTSMTNRRRMEKGSSSSTWRRRRCAGQRGRGMFWPFCSRSISSRGCQPWKHSSFC